MDETMARSPEIIEYDGPCRYVLRGSVSVLEFVPTSMTTFVCHDCSQYARGGKKENTSHQKDEIRVKAAIVFKFRRSCRLVSPLKKDMSFRGRMTNVELGFQVVINTLYYNPTFCIFTNDGFVSALYT
ncbi:hypothetical protein MPTK1_7g17220 [Marchantia polymorpha subsp. ruderalis]|uniref:Uncharacterized protein n=2 Tax=Marchantia polymorpha TaxID=3197 RepID=A0AAF6C0P7_MARPO|nr:hypothetical protein MARPO_0051s0059 [Marchantia polymorpha]BBN17831.1 hypothetical protein Mp_7g17220 [Marchantia polymorpha subsp. ruderalis]|eukprot:PTQ38456.1 hypothetical protein MARPO_0051s0059 [Marchantia polymorpha]